MPAERLSMVTETLIDGVFRKGELSKHDFTNGEDQKTTRVIFLARRL